MKTFRLSLICLCASATAALSGCGFTPLHATNTAGYSSALPAMSLNFTDTQARGATGKKTEFLLRQALSDRMGQSSAPAYDLRLESKMTRSAIGIRSDDIAARYDMVLTVNYELVRKDNGKRIAKDKVRTVSTFNSPADPYSRTAAQDDAEIRITNEAADRLILKVSKSLRGQ